MTSRAFLSILVLFPALSLCVCAAEPSHPVRLEAALLNPELVIQHAQDLGIDQTQLQAIHEVMQQAQENYGTLQGNLQREVSALSELLQQNSPDEKTALAQLDKVLDAERDIKRAHLSLALAIRGKLTPAQRARVRELQQKMVAEERSRTAPMQLAIREKFQRLQAGFRSWREQGRDMSALQPIMEELSPIIQQGKFNEAEPIIDRGLKVLEDGKK